MAHWDSNNLHYVTGYGIDLWQLKGGDAARDEMAIAHCEKSPDSVIMPSGYHGLSQGEHKPHQASHLSQHPIYKLKISNSLYQSIKNLLASPPQITLPTKSFPISTSTKTPNFLKANYDFPPTLPVPKPNTHSDHHPKYSLTYTPPKQPPQRNVHQSRPLNSSATEESTCGDPSGEPRSYSHRISRSR